MSATIEEDENANELQFGNINFDEVETLTNDEMYLLLAKRHNAGMTNEWALPPNSCRFMSVLKYFIVVNNGWNSIHLGYLIKRLHMWRELPRLKLQMM